MANYILKICLLGDAAVGKTSLVYRFIENRFSKDFKTTLGVNLLKKSLEIEGETVSVQIWDLGGQNAYKNLRKLYLEGAQGALIIFDITQLQSFKNLEEWINSLYEVRKKSTPIILLGNKIDLVQHQVVNQTQIEEFIADKNIKFLFTSAKEGTEVENAFRSLIKAIIDGIKEKTDKE